MTWTPREVLLAFELLPGKHTRDHLQDVFVAVLRRFSLQKKVLAVTSDNGSNVLSMLKLFQEFMENDEYWAEW